METDSASLKQCVCVGGGGQRSGSLPAGEAQAPVTTWSGAMVQFIQCVCVCACVSSRVEGEEVP